MTETFTRKWLQTSPVSQSPGAALFRTLEDEMDRVTLLSTNASPSGNTVADVEAREYRAQLRGIHSILADSMMSSVHREIFHYHMNNGEQRGGAWRVACDEDESHIVNDPPGESEDDDVRSQSSSGEVVGVPGGGGEHGGHQHHHHHHHHHHQQHGGGAGGAGKHDKSGAAGSGGSSSHPPATQQDQKTKRREEAKKKRAEDEQLLKMKRVRSSEKSFLLNTIGPFAPPRVTVRSLKFGRSVPSRKMLNQRLQLDQLESSSSSTDEEERDLLQQAASCSPPEGDDADTFKKLVKFLSPLSMDSLKKVSESAKVKLRAGCSQEDAVNEIAKAAVKLGCEKACVLMDKNKMLDKVASHTHTTRTHILAQLATNIPTFLGSLSPELLKLLSPTLGIPADTVTVPEMWERIVAMGLCTVLTHLRPRPLKKISQEVSVTLNDSLSTERQCEQVVFAVFPRERLRLRQSKAAKKIPGVDFSVTGDRIRCFEDMGFIGFTLHNISHMRGDAGERHYSPEFEFGNLRWSLLCMSNKDSLALYLCQQGSVHCKFVISVVNHQNSDDSVYNEGTQEFKSSSSENDWGFNNVIKFEQLLDLKNGFWTSENDSITIDVGIVLVESTTVAPSGGNSAGGATGLQQEAAQAGAGGGGGGAGGGKNANGGGKQQQGGAGDKAAQNRRNINATADGEQAVIDNNTGGGGGGGGRNKGGADQQHGGGGHQQGGQQLGQHASNVNASNKGGSNKSSQKAAAAAEKRLAADVAQQLLEQERLEAQRKKIKTELSKLHKDEERLRRDFQTKCLRDLTQLSEQCKREEQRINREMIEREKREQLERQREQEKLRVMQEQHQELRRKLNELNEESNEVANKKKAVATEISDLKTNVDAQKQELVAADASLEDAQAKAEEARVRLEERKARLAQIRARIEEKPPVQESTSQSLAEDSEIMRSVQQSLASIIDF